MDPLRLSVTFLGQKYEMLSASLASLYFVIGVDVHIYYVCGPIFFFNRNLAIDSPFQTFAVGLLV